MGKQTGWYIETETYLNETEYSIVRDPDIQGMQKMCLGVFRSYEELKRFGDMLQKALDDGRAAMDARSQYEQIIAAIIAERE